jgi:hypothetical protein
MGVYDRDYMLEKKPEKLATPASTSPYRRPVENRAPLWARIKFRLWLFFRRR